MSKWKYNLITFRGSFCRLNFVTAVCPNCNICQSSEVNWRCVRKKKEVSMNLRKSSSPTCDIVSILHRIPKRSPISRNSWKNSYFSQKVVIIRPVIRTLFILLLTLTMVEYYSDYNRSIGRKVMPLMQLFWLPARQSTFVAYRRLLNLIWKWKRTMTDF